MVLFMVFVSPPDGNGEGEVSPHLKKCKFCGNIYTVKTGMLVDLMKIIMVVNRYNIRNG